MIKVLLILAISICVHVASLDKVFTLPQKFGNYSLSTLSSAPPCGDGLASYNDIVSYSNGDYQGTGDSCSGWSSTGLQYQCVEYAQRYFNSLYGVAPVWPVDFAYQMCSSYPDGITPVDYPSAGYGVVFNWPPYGTTIITNYYNNTLTIIILGHVAVVIGVNDGTIDVIEQNGSPTGTNTYYLSEVLCFLSP